MDPPKVENSQTQNLSRRKRGKANKYGRGKKLLNAVSGILKYLVSRPVYYPSGFSANSGLGKDDISQDMLCVKHEILLKKFSPTRLRLFSNKISHKKTNRQQIWPTIYPCFQWTDRWKHKLPLFIH